MDDLKKMNVKALRELAKRHLGSEEARLKTKDELVNALKGALDKASASAEKAGKEATSRVQQVATRLKDSANKAVAVAKRVTQRDEEAPKTQRKASSGDGSSHEPPGPVPRKGSAGPAKVVRFQRKKGAAASAQDAEQDAQTPAEPLVEGFFVARVVGEAEARRHNLTEERAVLPREGQGGGYDEHLGELPAHYEDDAVLLLPRDPHTLFFLWDFKSDTRASAAQGLPDPRARLRVFDGPSLVRELDFALESGTYYIHDLVPGRAYRVEAHFVGSNGETRRVGYASNVIALPARGPSSNTEVRFLRIPWGLSLARLKEFLRDGRARIGGYNREKHYVEVRAGYSGSSSTLPSELAELSAGDRGWTPPPSGRGI